MRAGAASLTTLVLVLAAGCGDDNGSSKSEFVAKADAICKATTPPDTPTPKTAGDAKKAAQAQVDYRKPIQAQLDKLDPPDEVKADFDKFQAATQKSIDDFKQQVDAAAKNQESRYGTLNSQIDDLFKQRQQLANKIGFKFCGQPIAPAKKKK
jgi:hypothetical protein